MNSDDLIPNQWYPIFDAARLARRRPVGVKRLGIQLVLWRDAAGSVVAMPDKCSHRAARLSLGKVRDGCLECPFHGLRFNASGRCVLIPANGIDATVPHAFDIQPALVREAHGLIWYWHGAPGLATAAETVPWIPEGPEPSSRANTVERDYPVSYLRIMENFGDMHHVPFVHRTTIPFAGTRVRMDEARIDDGIVRMKASLLHERPGWLRPTYKFSAAIALPTLAMIAVARGVGFIASATPIDDDHTWLWARYSQDYVPGWLGGRILARMAAKYDLEMVFSHQDMKMIASQQANVTGDISHYQLFEADRAIALYFAVRKQAIDGTDFTAT